MLRPGDVLDDCEIVAPIKRGGMATLYLGRRGGAAGFARPVAIKVVHPELADDRRFVEMFVAEAHLCARIDHPNVVRVEELRERDGTYYLVMEYVRGHSLAQLLVALDRSGLRFEPALAAALAVAVADGLHAAHETRGDDGEPLGVVHRDVSPQNVLVAASGHVKLIDFGIARVASRTRTATGTLQGKLQYMPPEQAYGRAIDRRADVYALGVVLWEMLALRHLFDADNELALLELVRNPVVVPPSRHAPGVPPALDAAVMRALAPRPEDRPPTARALRELLVSAVPAAGALDADALAKLVRDALGEPPSLERLGFARTRSIAPRGPEAEATTPGLDAPPTVTVPDAGPTLHDREPPAERRRARWPLALGGSVLGAALVASAVVLASRAPASTTARAPAPPPHPAPAVAAPPLAAPAPADPPSPTVATPPSVAAAPSHGTRASHARSGHHHATRPSDPGRIHYVNGLPVARNPF